MNENELKNINESLDGNPDDFQKAKKELLSKLLQEPSEEAIKLFSVRRNINLEDAKKRLQENYKKEVEEVEFKEVALRLSNAMKVISPKMLGLEQRELERENRVKEAINKSNEAIDRVNFLEEKLHKLQNKPNIFKRLFSFFK
jgi:hypothetical protein